MKAILPLTMVLLAGFLPDCPAADSPLPGRPGQNRQKQKQSKKIVERQYQLNRLLFTANLRRASNGTSTETAEEMLKRLLKKQTIDAELVSLNVEGELMVVRAVEGVIEAVWKLVRELNGSP